MEGEGGREGREKGERGEEGGGGERRRGRRWREEKEKREEGERGEEGGWGGKEKEDGGKKVEGKWEKRQTVNQDNSLNDIVLHNSPLSNNRHPTIQEMWGVSLYVMFMSPNMVSPISNIGLVLVA